ncbi:hypothetical protein MMC34_007352 [Xylographa carneopallida]|nr:hypothetical protein [Xylographa carneopallida]
MASVVHKIRQSENASFLIVGGNFPLDKNVIAALPPESTITSANEFGSSAWTATARINIISDDKTSKSYFLKCAAGKVGARMLEGEYNAMVALHAVTPSFVPQPLTWGKFHAPDPEMYFFLCDFVDMDIRLPDPVQFCSRLAELHRTSESPTGQFGFHVPTFQGKFEQPVEWDSNWASFWSKLLVDILRRDHETNGPWNDLDTMSQRLLSHVVPRLLGALQANGRVLKPCLIHGDLWDGNIGTSFATSNVFIFDAAAYYAHNEEEIGMWRCERHKIKSKVYKREYLKNFTVSEPADEWDDRNRLYGIKFNMFHSAHYTGQSSRNLCAFSFAWK